MRTLLTLFLSAGVLASCTLTPEYERPEFPVAQSWEHLPGYDFRSGTYNISQMHWENFFLSPQMRFLIGMALDHNTDVKTAALNIEEARAIYRIERSDILPSLEARGEASYVETSDESSVTGRAVNDELYEAKLGLPAYEVDLFGRLRSLNEAALNEYLATRQAYVSVRNALIAETANAYLQLLTDEKLLGLTKKTLVAQEKTHSILRESLENGVATEQDVARAATAVELARVNFHRYKRFIAQDKNALFRLVGVAQEDSLLPEGRLSSMEFVRDIDPLLPSQVLLMRPDVRQAEFELLARNANIGAARAAFFPTISLTGAYGYASESLSELFTEGAFGAWSFIPRLTLPIFKGGQNVANLDLAEIRKEKAVVNYESAIQQAFKEVANELAARATLDQQLLAQLRLVEAARKVYDISQARYDHGIDNFLSVLDAQRELYEYEQSAIQTESELLKNLVNLYRVLGGGTLAQEKSGAQEKYGAQEKSGANQEQGSADGVEKAPALEVRPEHEETPEHESISPDG